MINKILTAAIILAVMTIFTAGALCAQEERNIHIPVDTTNYDLYAYPTGGAQLNLPYRFESKFSITNGKYFYIQFEEFIGIPECNIDIYFYTLDGKQIAKQHVKELSNSYNIPQNKESIKSTVLNVRVVNNGRKNQRNFKMIVAVPKESVDGAPAQPYPSDYDTYQKDK